MEVPRKRQRDELELRVSQGSEAVNKNLLKCLVVLTKHIIDVHSSKYDPVRYATHTVIKAENDNSCDIDITEHNITRTPTVQLCEDDLSRNISLLKEQTLALEKMYNSGGLSDSVNQTNYKKIDNSLRASVVQHLSEHSANLTEQICNLISMYKSQETEENVRNIRKCLSKINKKIKSLPFQTNASESASDSSVFFSTINKPNLSVKESAYLSAAHNLSDKLTVLIKKVSKLKKVYKKRVLSVCEPAVKKPKLITISNNESTVINNNDNTFNNSVPVNFNNDLENNCSTPKSVKKSRQITNIDDLNEISIVNNEKTLDNVTLEPGNSKYVHSELEPFTNNEKPKRKSKEKSENSSKNSIIVEAIVHNENTGEVTITKKTKTSNNTIENNETEDVVIEIESNDNCNVITEQVPKRKRKKKRKNSDISDSMLHDIVHSICADIVHDNELAAERNNESEQNNDSEERQLKKKRRKDKKSTENVEENITIIENNDEVEKKVKRKKKKRKDLTNLEETFNLEETSEIIQEINSERKIKNDENDTKNTQELLSENNEKVKKNKNRIKSVEYIIDNSSESDKESAVQNNDKKKTKHKKTTVPEVLIENNENDTKKKKKKRIKSVEYINDNSSESDNEISIQNNDSEILPTEIHKKKHKKTTIENNENFSEVNNELGLKKKHKKKKSTETVNEMFVKNNENDTKNKLENINNTVAEESPKKKIKKKKKSTDNSSENSPEILIENNENNTKNKLNINETVAEESPKKKIKKKKKSTENSSENTPQILVENNETDIRVNNEITLKKKRKKEKKSVEFIGEDSLEKIQEILVKKYTRNNETNANVNNEIIVKKKHKKLNKSFESIDNKPPENIKNVSIKIENNDIPKLKSKKISENIDKENIPIIERINEYFDKENLSILERIIENIDKENIPIIERINENIDKENIPILERINENNDKENIPILERINENIDKENIPIIERIREKFNEKLKLENSDENNEQFDFSSVLKVELEEEDEFQQNFNVNFVPWNSCLQDEELDEREQYLYLREMVENAKEKMELSEETKDRLRGLCVLLDFEVPSSHKIENRLCMGPTKEQAEQLAALGVKSGPLAKDEDEQIRRNWELFYKLHDIPNDPTPFLALQYGQDKLMPFEERKKFVQFLGRGLSNRPLHSIYRRFKVLYKVTKNGRFSEDEDMLILSYVKFSGHNTKFADLMPILNRSRGAIEARYRALKKGLQKVSWDLELKAQLLKHMMTVMSVQNSKDLQHADITHAHLSEVARRMNLPVVKIRHQWCTKLYTQLFAAQPLYLDQMKVDLVERLYELKIDDWRKVDWCEVAKTFPGVSPVSLRVLMKSLFRYNCPKRMQADLGAIINHCRLIVMPELKKRPDFNQRFINRLKLKKDGTLKEYI